MFSKILKQLFRNKFTTTITLLVVILGGYFGYQAISGGNEAIRYTLAAIEKGTLVVSVSGSGQVTALDQIDIKPEVSGDIIGIYINKDQAVKTGQLLAEIDTKNAQQAVYDAEITLDDAKEKLADLLSQPEAQPLRQAEVALAQAERDLNKAKETYENIEIDAENSLVTAYEDGYGAVFAAFLKLSNYMKDLKDVLGTEQFEREYIDGYKLIIGQDSPFIQKLLYDYSQATPLFDKNYAFFITVFKDDNRDIIGSLISDTIETTKAISLTLDSARHMFDAIAVNYYQNFKSIASQIDKMKPKIESDASAVSSIINSIQQIEDTIDDTIKTTPERIEDAKWALESAQENFDEKKLVLEKLRLGADPKDIMSQENIVAQKKDALLDAQEKLAGCSIHAPFNGVVAEVNDKIKKGDSVSASTILATLITQQKIAQISLNEIDAANIKVDQKVTLTFDALPDVSIAGKVAEVDTIGQASQGVVSYGVKIAFDTDIEEVKPGMSVTVDIITEAKQDVLVLPSSAIKFQGNTYYVELVEADEEFNQQLLANVSGIILPTLPKLQTIEIGLSNDLSTEVISGLEEGDIVVTSEISSTVSQTTQTTQTQGFQIPGINTRTSGTGGDQMRTFENRTFGD